MISLGLRYFLEVARSGSIAAAAGAQHVAASAVSRQIAKLEDELGIALFERQARGMALSDAGRQLAAYASAAALEAERVATEIRHRGEQGDVTVRLACTEGFAHRFLPQCMAEFKRLRPQARFHLRVERPGRSAACCWKASRKSDCVTPRSMTTACPPRCCAARRSMR